VWVRWASIGIFIASGAVAVYGVVRDDEGARFYGSVVFLSLVIDGIVTRFRNRRGAAGAPAEAGAVE
jgi:hypothetical protein